MYHDREHHYISREEQRRREQEDRRRDEEEREAERVYPHEREKRRVVQENAAITEQNRRTLADRQARHDHYWGWINEKKEMYERGHQRLWVQPGYSDALSKELNDIYNETFRGGPAARRKITHIPTEPWVDPYRPTRETRRADEMAREAEEERNRFVMRPAVVKKMERQERLEAKKREEDKKYDDFYKKPPPKGTWW